MVCKFKAISSQECLKRKDQRVERFKYELISLPQQMHCDTFTQGLHGGGEVGEYARTGARHVKPGRRPGVVIQGTQGQDHQGPPLGTLGHFGNLGHGHQGGHQSGHPDGCYFGHLGQGHQGQGHQGGVPCTRHFVLARQH